ncbi:hypothetical protein [Geobacillus sp. C56-T2]|uniref:hypothetical protein n=1 Tax=Geobacillus sp. C56-T2 TaxID=600773 RepID=UPI00119FB835|nr:hypothetical protein [Geobacillus sp. C56-T2]TWG30829.1 hypothetical protein GC56T2_2011 [Geobacillus sp. C56-T2]
MRWVLVDAWSDRSAEVIDAVVEEMLVRGFRSLAIHFFLHESEWHRNERKRWDEWTSAIEATVEWHLVPHGIGLAEQLEFVRSRLRGIKEGADRVLLPLGRGEANLQQMVAHEAVQLFADKTVVWLEELGIESAGWANAYIRNEDIYHHVDELIAAGNFHAAQRLLEGKVNDERIQTLLEFGERLKSLRFSPKEFECYLTVLKESLSHIDREEAEKEAAFIEQMKGLATGEQRAFLFFLHSYAELLYEQQELIDFIVIYYRLAEEALLYALGWDAHDEERGFPFFDRPGAQYRLPLGKQKRLTRHFHRYMKALSQEVREMERRENVRIRRDRCVGLERLSSRDRYFADLYLLFNEKAFESLLDLRHEGVSGHGFADFSAEMFEGLLGGETPMQKMNRICDYLGIWPAYSIFRLI